MSNVAPAETPLVRWDLSALSNGFDDPRIDQYWAQAESAAKVFAENYRDRIGELTAAELAEAIHSMEEIYQTAAKPLSYAGLRFAADSADPAVGAFMQKQQERGTGLSVLLMFFELELQAIPAARISELVADPALGAYRHYVQTTCAMSPYRLTEKEEIILEEVANTGSRAWTRFYDETLANHEFKLYRPGATEPEIMTEQEVLDLLRDGDRAVRQAAADSLTAGLTEIERLLVFNFNNMLQDKAVEDRLRGFDYPEQSRHLANELDREIVDLVIRLCREQYGLVARYYHVKREILGYDELTHIDRYAPLFESEELIDWDSARELVLTAFGQFSPEMSRRAEEFFVSNWIDAEARPGKRGGAFCSYNTPDTHPVVFQSYLNKLNDVMTLAHELGHGVHASLSRAQTYFNYHGTLPLAELASTFGETLVFEKLVEQASLKDKVALYADKIEGMFATVFRQAAMFRFEQRAHEARRSEGEQTLAQLNAIWHEEQQAMFGDSVKLGEQHARWWSYIPHFVHTPFYVYAYSFGELLALSLYGKAKEQGAAFEPKYLEVLTRGGSLNPEQLMAIVDVDLRSEEFWRGGFRAMETFMSEFERLWAEYQAQTAA